MDSLRDIQFDAASPDLAALLDALPQLQLDHPDTDTEWLSEWLSDTASMFRLLRRHKFVRTFALEEIRAISIWRIRVLRPVLLLPIPALFHCLPPPITDPFGRPMVFLKLASLHSLPCSLKDVLLQEAERLRLHLRYIRDHCTHTGPFPLQYLVLVDLDGVSIQNYNLDLCSWILTDIIPRYPGMLAAVFLLNYSWIYSGAWSVAKRILPSSTTDRVFFPSKDQLVSYCSVATLPAEYGGSLPTLDQIDNALCSPYQTHHLPPPPPDASPAPRVLDAENPISPTSPSPCTAPPHPTLQRAPSTIVLPPLSSRNPFFGYPAIASTSSPHTIRHVQRGPRALARTLAVLLWRRWRRWVWTGVCAVVLVWVLRMRRARAGAGASVKALVGVMSMMRVQRGRT